MDNLNYQHYIDKKSYSPPILLVLGKVEEVTQASGSGNRLDVGFQAGTSVDDLTFFSG